MAEPLNTCTTIEQLGVVRFLWANNMDAAKDIHKKMLPIWAAFLCGYPLLPYFFLETALHGWVFLFEYLKMHGTTNPNCSDSFAVTVVLCSW
jgi:hypothetical protein